MTAPEQQVVIVEREIAASAQTIFDLIADPARQPEWDGNDNLEYAAPGQRVRAVGDIFVMTLTRDHVIRQNHVVEFVEGTLIAWQPSEQDTPRPGHLWRWELEPITETRTRVAHTYDWTQLRDDSRVATARAMTADKLRSSLDRLAAVAKRR